MFLVPKMEFYRKMGELKIWTSYEVGSEEIHFILIGTLKKICFYRIVSQKRTLMIINIVMMVLINFLSVVKDATDLFIELKIKLLAKHLR